MTLGFNWELIGKGLEELKARGFYPAVGYDDDGWSVWTFLAPPEEWSIGELIKERDDNPEKAMTRLLAHPDLGDKNEIHDND